MPSTLDSFTCAVITGAGGGLGRAFAHWLHAEGKKVILVGRTESNIQHVSSELNNAPYYVLDTGNTQHAPAFAHKIIQQHPDVDSLWNNAGVQRPLDIRDLDLAKLDQEIDINIRGPIHLATAFLPHFKSKPSALIVNVTSVLGLLPFSIINPGYNGTKAYMRFFSMTQRTQLEKHAPHVRIVDIAPPAVGTDLHRDREDPDDNKPQKGAKHALTVEQFMDDVRQGFAAGQDVVSAGMGKDIVQKWDDTFAARYNEAADGYKKS